MSLDVIRVIWSIFVELTSSNNSDLFNKHQTCRNMKNNNFMLTLKQKS